MKRIILALISFVATCSINAQNPFQWVASAGSSTNDAGCSITYDASGNVYTAGYFSNTVDFDPGPGSFTLASAGNQDVFILKLDAAGNFLWAKSMGGIYTDWAQSIALDASGNIYLTGFFSDNADFDPGAGTFLLSAVGNLDVFVLKLDPAGNFLWAKGVGGSSDDLGKSIGLNAAGEVLVTGYYTATTDFDPGAGIYNLSPAGASDSFVLKLDAAGNFVWARSIGGTSDDQSNSIRLDNSGNVYTTGFFSGTADFDPGAGVYTMTGAGVWTIYVCKFDALGNFVWAKALAGAANSWNWASAVITDALGNVFTTGSFEGTVDFDPGAGSFSLTSAGSSDAFMSKLDAAGNFVWAGRVGGTAGDWAHSIDLDVSGNIHLNGKFSGTADFDPGVGAFNLTAFGFGDAFISKYDPAGNFLSAVQLGGASGIIEGVSIKADGSGNVYTTGYYTNTTDFDPGPLSYSLTPTSPFGPEIYVHKLGPCLVAPAPPTDDTPAGNRTVCSGLTATLTASASGAGISWFGSAVGGTPVATGNVFMPANLATGSYTYYAEAVDCNVSTSRTPVTVTVIPSPTIVVNSGTICSGQSFTFSPTGAFTYTYSNGNGIVSPATTSTYSVAGTSTAGCTSSASAMSTVSVFPLPVVSVNSGSICVGQSFTIIPAGASTYTISGGNFIVNPAASASYSISGASADGCVSATPAIASLTVNPLPAISILTTDSILCVGETATLSAAGASSYTWNATVAALTVTVSPAVTSSYSVSGSTALGCISTAAFSQSVSACTGISGAGVEDNDVVLYPNPAQDQVTVSLLTATIRVKSIELTNHLGQVMRVEPIENATTMLTISTGTLPGGVYQIRLKTSSGTVIRQFIKLN